MSKGKSIHLRKVEEIMPTLSPVHQYKVAVYAEVLKEIEQEQEQQKNQRLLMQARIVEQLPKLNDGFLRDTMVVADTLLNIQQRKGGEQA